MTTMTDITQDERLYAAKQPSPIMGYCGQIDRTTLHMEGNTYGANITDYRAHMQTDVYKEDFARMIDFLKNRNCLTSEDRCRDFFEAHANGVKIESTAYTYYVTYDPDKANVDIYSYVGGALDAHIEEARRGIRFLDEHYHEQFRIKDGEKITIDYNNGDDLQERTCRYIDDYHFVTAENNGIWHTSQFAEAARGWTVKPLSPKSNTITALMIEPGKAPRKTEITDKLSAYQQAVGGYIECVYPWEDTAGIICNEEGKLMNLPLNRALRNEETGEIYDVVAGNMLIVGLGDEGDFVSLTDEQLRTYTEKYRDPERFYYFDGKIVAKPIPAEKQSKGLHL